MSGCACPGCVCVLLGLCCAWDPVSGERFSAFSWVADDCVPLVMLPGSRLPCSTPAWAAVLPASLPAALGAGVSAAPDVVGAALAFTFSLEWTFFTPGTDLASSSACLRSAFDATVPLSVITPFLASACTFFSVGSVASFCCTCCASVSLSGVLLLELWALWSGAVVCPWLGAVEGGICCVLGSCCVVGDWLEGYCPAWPACDPVWARP